MNKYNIVILESAIQDVSDLSNTISLDYKSPLTAVRYLRGLKTEIAKLSRSAESYSIQTRPYYRQYGFNVRRIIYKRMVIVFTVADTTVYIRAIVSAATVTGL